MKGKVYRRGINPSIHQARAAAKDLISSGASKHGVLLISLPRHRIGLGRRGGGHSRSERGKKNPHNSLLRPSSLIYYQILICMSPDLSEHQERNPLHLETCMHEGGGGEGEREETSIAPINAHANRTCTHTVARNALIFRDEFTVVTIRYRVMRNIFRKPAYRHLKARPPSLKIICNPSIQLSWA